MNEELSIEIARVQRMRDSTMRNERLHRLYAVFHTRICVEMLTLATSHMLHRVTEYDDALHAILAAADALNKARENHDEAEDLAEMQRK